MLTHRFIGDGFGDGPTATLTRKDGGFDVVMSSTARGRQQHLISFTVKEPCLIVRQFSHVRWIPMAAEDELTELEDARSLLLRGPHIETEVFDLRYTSIVLVWDDGRLPADPKLMLEKLRDDYAASVDGSAPSVHIQERLNEILEQM